MNPTPMPETTEAMLRDVFEQYQRGETVELWRLPDVLGALNVQASEEDVYAAITQLEIKNTLSMKQLADIVGILQNQAANEVDDDITEAWIVLDGREDMTGTVKVQALQQMCDRMGMKIRFEAVLKAYYRSKNVVQYNLHDIGFQTFKDIFTAFQDIID